MFDLDEYVQTPNGRGYVTYVEDGYIEVEVAGNEFTFTAPFKGLVSMEKIQAEANAAKEFADRQAARAFDELSDAQKHKAWMNWSVGSSLVQLIGGSAAEWEDLTDQQKLNFAGLKL